MNSSDKLVSKRPSHAKKISRCAVKLCEQKCFGYIMIISCNVIKLSFGEINLLKQRSLLGHQ